MEEKEEIFRNIEMFEAVARANPDDYQSLEILKEAYWKIGRQRDGVVVSRRLAEIYMRMGQYSSAMLEYEGLLQVDPGARDIQALVAELDKKLNPGKKAAPKLGVTLDFGLDEGQLSEINAPMDGAISQHPSASDDHPGSGSSLVSLTGRANRGRNGAASRTAVSFSLDADGNEPLSRFLIQHRLASHEVINSALDHVFEFNNGLAEGKIAATLMGEIAKADVDLDSILSGIVDRTKCAYIPLAIYDVDRQIVKMLPETLTLGRSMVPFDIVSRTMMVAFDNPFDTAARAAVEQTVDYHVQWHLAHPGALRKVLRDAYRLND